MLRVQDNPDVRGDIASRDFYCRSMYLTANSTQSGYQNNVDYFMIGGDHTPIQLARTAVTSDANGSESTVKIFSKAATDTTASTCVASLKPSAISFSSTQLVCQTLTGQTMLTLQSSGASFPGTVVANQGTFTSATVETLTSTTALTASGTLTVGGLSMHNKGVYFGNTESRGASSYLTFYQQGYSETITLTTADISGTSVSNPGSLSMSTKATRLGNVVVLSFLGSLTSVTCTSAMFVLQGSFLTSSTTWRPQHTLTQYVAGTVQGASNFKLAATIGTSGTVVIKYTSLGSFTSFNPSQAVTPQPFVFTYDLST